MTYSFSYDGLSRPKWEKVFTATNGETFKASLYFENAEDKNELTLEQVESYLGLLMQYAKNLSSNFELLPLLSDLPDNPYPISGDYLEYKWALQELRKWWDWAYFNDNFETSPEPVDQEPQ